MRSRTSLGVLEWSGGEDLYMVSCHADTGKFWGHIGIVPGPPEGFRGSTGRGHPSRRASWAKGEGENQPTKGWCTPPHTHTHTPFPTLFGEVGRLHLAWEAILHMLGLGGKSP